MLGRTPGGINVVYPMRDGVVADYALSAEMLKYFIQAALGHKVGALGVRLVLCLPLCVTEVERRALADAARGAGARDVLMLDEPLAAAVGADLPVFEPIGSMVVDIGGGTTDVAVLALGGIAASASVRTGGTHLDAAIREHVQKAHGVMVGERTAEELKIDIGSARMRGVKLEMDACGRSLVSGLPRAVTVSSEEMIEALDEPLRDLMSALHRMIERTPPELASDIFDEGITLSGGGAQLFGLDGVISDQLKIRTTLADEPDLCVAHGLSELIDDEERYENIDLVSGSRSDLLGDE